MRGTRVAFGGMLLALVLLILWVVAELFVAIQVAQAIGVLVTIVLLILTWPLGIWAVRSQGRAAWRRLTVAVTEGRAPGVPVLDGVLVLIGGIMLIVPGFITDALGVCLLLAPTRRPLRRLLVANLRRRLVVPAARGAPRGSAGRGEPTDVEGRPDVESTARDVDQPHLQRPAPR